MPSFPFSAEPKRRSGVLEKATYRILLVETEIALWLSLLLFAAPSALKYLSVLIPFFLALPALFVPRSPCLLLPVALAFTLVADAFFLLLTPPRPLVAIGFFLVVQVVYFFYLRSDVGRARLLRALALRVAICLAVFAPTFFLFGADPIVLLGAVYGVWLVSNLLVALRGKDPLFAIGMVLFFSCDLSLGVGFLFVRAGDAALSGFFGGAAWVFYPPSQTLIALSADVDRGGLARE